MRLRFVILLCTMFSSGSTIAQEKKNLLFIITDQQRYDALGFAGNTVIQTPNLDRLAQQGVYFRNAYTPCAVCGPARSSILTGLRVENTGVYSNEQTYYYAEEGIMQTSTFDEILAENGYRCEYYGKWHALSSHAEVYENPVQVAENGKSIFGPGGQSHIWRDYLKNVGIIPAPGEGEFIDGMSKWPYLANPLDRYFGTSYQDLQNQGFKHSQPDQHGKLSLNKEHTMTAFQAGQTLEAIERLKDSTFSITCSFHFPHSPMLAPEPWYGMYPVEEMIPPVSINDPMNNSPYVNSNSRQKRTEYADPEKIKYMISEYYGLVSEIDHWVGEILDMLDSLNIADKTMVIFTSDHGEMLGAHGMREKNIFYEESAHIPLLMRFPGEMPTQTTVDGYVSLVDLFPTILDYLDIPERDSDGKSLRGLIEGTDTIHGRYVVTEWDRPGISNYMVVKDGWKLIIPYTIQSSVINALYDLNTDPYEMNNLLGNNPDKGLFLEKAEELRSCLLEWLAKRNSIHYYSVSQRDLLYGGKPTGNNAIFVSQEIPDLSPGDSVTVHVTMKNTGVTAWTTAGQFHLGSQAPVNNSTWGVSRVALNPGDTILPGGEKRFTFTISVPDTDGIFVFQWQMSQEAEEWFGEKSDARQLLIGDPGLYMDACEDLSDWKSSSGLILNTTNQQQGLGCLEFSSERTDEFKKVFTTPYDTRGTPANTELSFWYYVSDNSKFETSNQVEIGSAGKPDVDEYNWKLTELTNGWNLIRLKTSKASVIGSPDLSRINWFRIYHKKTGKITTRLDAIRLVDPTVGPSYTLLVNNGTGGGNYFENDQISITASPRSDGAVFDQWVVDRGAPIIGDASAANTILIMGAGSTVVSATYKEPLAAMPHIGLQSEMSVYPIPAHSGISVVLHPENAGEAQILLWDMWGRKQENVSQYIQLEPGSQEFKIPLNGTKPGAYILQVIIHGQLFSKPLLIL